MVFALTDLKVYGRAHVHVVHKLMYALRYTESPVGRSKDRA